jgi:hypothetical protein
MRIGFAWRKHLSAVSPLTADSCKSLTRSLVGCTCSAQIVSEEEPIP